MDNKFILDACCAMRYMWRNKHHPNAIYMDNRNITFMDRKEKVVINPDIVGDFTNLPLEIKNRRFKLILWDVPHFKVKKLSGGMLMKFGALNPETWQSDISKGFNELWSVLDDYGVLLFKFSDYHIKFNDILKCISIEPLVVNKTHSSGKSDTKWFCFMKIPNDAKDERSVTNG